MATLINLYPYISEDETTVKIPTSLFSPNLYLELRPLDVAVFIKLLITPNGSAIDRQAIADGLGINVRTVTKAFLALQKNNFLSYKRNRGGYTVWTINLSRFEGGL